MTPLAFTAAVPEDSFTRPAPEGVDRNISVELEPGVISWMKESQLHRRVGLSDDEDEAVVWVEYRLGGKDGRIVHRSAHLQLKKMPQPIQAEAGAFV